MDIVNLMIEGWREAENSYLKDGDDSFKNFMLNLHLYCMDNELITPDDIREIEDGCNQLGV